MAAKPDVSGYERFSDVTSRLDEIVLAVRDKNTPLERSLDLFDEAIALGTRAVDLVDKAAFSPEERERLVEVDPRGESASAEGAAPADGTAVGAAGAQADSEAALAASEGPASSDVAAEAAPAASEGLASSEASAEDASATPATPASQDRA